ncbi:MAG: type III pantothenate kinase [Bacteroidales bacterium]|nr:type III pantothenate kinase [Bacteroidales bacterium]
MNLAIDIGNSSCKAGIYMAGKKEYVKYAACRDISFVEEFISHHDIDRAILSSVRRENRSFRELLDDKGIETLILSHQTPLPFKMSYESPETLGTDRLAAVAGAHNMFGKSNVLVIDAGTAVTYDLLESGSVYAGGNISPGLELRFKALNEFTGRLPLVSKADSFGNLGVNTVDAIRSGVQTGLVFEINEYIRTLKKKYGKLKVIITGGDGKFLAGKLETGFILEPHLVLDGLNYILDYNA